MFLRSDYYHCVRGWNYNYTENCNTRNATQHLFNLRWPSNNWKITSSQGQCNGRSRFCKPCNPEMYLVGTDKNSRRQQQRVPFVSRDLPRPVQIVMPIQTACCERGNSCVNRIMTDFRSSLDVSTVDAIMCISLNGPEHAEYNATRAVARWLDSGQRLRRPEIMDTWSCVFEWVTTFYWVIGVRLFTLVTYKYFRYVNINERLKSERVDTKNVTFFSSLLSHINVWLS